MLPGARAQGAGMFFQSGDIVMRAGSDTISNLRLKAMLPTVVCQLAPTKSRTLSALWTKLRHPRASMVPHTCHHQRQLVD
jgi:hypothetical protein